MQMKRSCFLPILSPEFVCYNHITFANAIIRANVMEDWQILMLSKYINCYYKEESTDHKFIISMYDHWCTAQKIMQKQSINLLKEIYQSQKINIVLIIKKFLLNNCYVFGQCNRSYVEKNDNIELSLFNYVVTGFDDINRQFTIYGLNAKENFYCVKIDYETFASALFDTLKPNIELTLWRYNLDACIDFDIQNIAFELEDYINSANRRNHYTEDKEYGIKAIERLGMYFIENSQCKKSRDEVYLKKLLCHKSYMRDRIACLGHHGYIDIKSYPYAEKVSLISKEILDVGCLINQSNKLTFITLLKQLFSEMIEIEKQYLPKVLDELKSFLR